LQGDDRRWRAAKRDAAGALRELGVRLPKNLSATFLDVELRGKSVAYIGNQKEPLLAMIRPPRSRHCPRVVRVCKKEFVVTQDARGNIVRAGFQTNCQELCVEPVAPLPWPAIAIDD
jgi:hypothetical protein